MNSPCAEGVRLCLYSVSVKTVAIGCYKIPVQQVASVFLPRQIAVAALKTVAVNERAARKNTLEEELHERNAYIRRLYRYRAVGCNFHRYLFVFCCLFGQFIVARDNGNMLGK